MDAICCIELNGRMVKDLHTSYTLISKIIAYMHEHWRNQPSISHIAKTFGLNENQLNDLFQNWANISPKIFMQSLTLEASKAMLLKGESVLNTTFEMGLSSPSRLHDLFVTYQAMPPGAYKNKGADLDLNYGFASSPFGQVLVVSSDYGLVGLSFVEYGDEQKALSAYQNRWSNAHFAHNEALCEHLARRIFNKDMWQAEQPLKIILIGTDFEIRVWEGLLKIPTGTACSYGQLARAIDASKAARAVGRAVGHNPIAFVVPCHRVLGKGGELTGYHWGLVRKVAILGWESQND